MTKVARMEIGINNHHVSLFILAFMFALLSHQSFVMSTTPFHDQKTYSHGHHTKTPTTPSINCDTPPHGGGGSHHHDPTIPSVSPPSGHHGGGGSGGSGGGSHHHDPTIPSVSPPSGHHGGGGSGGSGGGYYHSPPTYTPTPTTPSTPTPTTPIVTPSPPYSPDPITPPSYSPPSGTPPYYTPPSETPPSGTPPFPFDPNTPPAGTTPPSGFDPNSPPFPCNFWRTHPTLIWGMVGWNGNTIRTIFGMNNTPGFSSSVNLLEALSNTRTDGLGALYREGTAAMLNSMITNHFPYTTQQVRDSFGRAALSSNNAAAATQARLFKLANEGHLKPRS